MPLSQKDILRREAKKRRDHLSPGDPAAVIPRFVEALKPQAGQVIALYRIKGNEFDPAPLYSALQAMGCICALPIMIAGSRILRFAAWRDGDALEQGPFGIDQPADNAETVWVTPSIVAVPMLAFDARGTRLGYGGGYYDATLHALRQNGPVMVAGLAHEGQKTPDPLPAEPHDIRLDWAITPESALKFS